MGPTYYQAAGPTEALLRCVVVVRRGEAVRRKSGPLTTHAVLSAASCANSGHSLSTTARPVRKFRRARLVSSYSERPSSRDGQCITLLPLASSSAPRIRMGWGEFSYDVQ